MKTAFIKWKKLKIAVRWHNIYQWNGTAVSGKTDKSKWLQSRGGKSGPALDSSIQRDIHNGEEGLSIKHRILKPLHIWQLQDKYCSRLCITGIQYGNFCHSLWVWYAYDKSDLLERTWKFFNVSFNHISNISNITESMFSPKKPLW